MYLGLYLFSIYPYIKDKIVQLGKKEIGMDILIYLMLQMFMKNNNLAPDDALKKS